MRLTKIFLLLILFLHLAACGTYVPPLQEYNGGQAQAELLVKSIVNSVHCEVRNALASVVLRDRQARSGNRGKSYIAWLLGWGVQIQLTLTVEERTIVSPNAVGFPPSPMSAVLSIAGGATASSDATRIERLSFFYTVQDLLKRGPCTAGLNDSNTPSLLIRSDLGLREWLSAQVLLDELQLVPFPDNPKNIFKQNVLSHEVKFEVDTSANVTPALKLARATVNQSGSFLAINRNRTHDLLVTFGPVDPAQPLTLARPAQDTVLAAQITSPILTGPR